MVREDRCDRLPGPAADAAGAQRGRRFTLYRRSRGGRPLGNPLLDRSAFIPRVPRAQRSDVLAHWDDLWRVVAPGCDPGRAAELAGPLAALRQAVVYDGFVQAIEPSERVYHAGDSARWLRTLASEVVVHS